MKKLIALIGLMFWCVSCEPQNPSLKDVSVESLQEVLTTTKVQLLDVRTPQEWEYGIIEGAISINLFDEDFEKQALEKLDKREPVYVYCKSGGRSKKASEVLSKKGFEVYNVVGGYNEWKLKN
ncbi:Rhodanese-related sulfurtransferase [Tenacibaculum sp. 190130A14a]|uniref:Phage shock protein E n=1 Tax=Tenacibaculum polynesiense TaxID=3137857 RepID=A0ABM9PES5_9FLAO